MCVRSVPAPTGIRPVKLGFNFQCAVMSLKKRFRLFGDGVLNRLSVAAADVLFVVVNRLSSCALAVADVLLCLVKLVEMNVGLLAMCLPWLLSGFWNG